MQKPKAARQFTEAITVPIRHDTDSGHKVTVQNGGGGSTSGAVSRFEERQNDLWNDMQSRMAERRQKWNEEVDKMRSEFFKLQPISSMPSGHVSDGFSSDWSLQEDDSGDKQYQITFDVSHYLAEDINVKTEEGKLVVHAKHVEHHGGQNLSREFNRSVDLPRQVAPHSLSCALHTDGTLHVTAPLATDSTQLKISQHSMTSQRSHPTTAISLPVETVSGTSSGYSSLGSGGGTLKTEIVTSLDPAASKQSPVRTTAPPTYTSVATTAPPSVYRPPPNKGSFAPPAPSNPNIRERRFKFVIDIGPDFDPGDVNVKTVDSKLVVKARHEEKDDGRTSIREFSREYELPPNIDPFTVTAALAEGG